MKTLISTVLLTLVMVLGTAQETRNVFGKVSDGNNPMENVIVSILDKERVTETDEDGKYEIQVETGDKLQFSFTGMRTITIKIEDVTRVLNPIMIPDITELDEVTVAASKRRSQKDLKMDYSINKNIIKTAWGYVDADRAPGQVWMMDEDDINPVSVCIVDLLRNRIPGVYAIGDCINGGSIVSRRYSSLTQGRAFSFDIDGQLFNDVPIWIPVQAIKRIAVFPGLAMASRYGNFGGAGIIVINTINGNPQLDRIVDRVRLRNNFADGKELTQEQVAQNAPIYQKEFAESNSFEASKEVYEKYINKYFGSPYFVLDAYSHFLENYDNTNFADAIIQDNFKLFENNAVLLKALAYTYESQERFKEANKIYKEVFIHRPNYVQSYFDMANSYRNIKEPRQAASMYARYEYLLEEGFLEHDTVGFGPIMSREFNNLLMLEKESVVEGRKARKLFVAEEDFMGTRLVFEWNDGEAEFELQFVNPENQYHKWKHSMFDNVEEIVREKEFGYNVKEYLVDGSLPGTWQVNINYLGNKSLTPTYLKTTIYYNYGSRSQRKEVKVFKLSLKNVNQELFSIQSIAKLANR